MHSNACRSALKKTLRHPKANDALRAQFERKIHAYTEAGRSIIYLDESGFAHDMPRIRGYSERGQRCYGTHDWHSKGRVNAIGAIIGFSFLVVGLFEGNINSDVFYAWLMQELLPVLPDQAIIVMDNASFHKRDDMVEAIEQSGHQLEYLPPYSPDLNPIEKSGRKLKLFENKNAVMSIHYFPSMWIMTNYNALAICRIYWIFKVPSLVIFQRE